MCDHQNEDKLEGKYENLPRYLWHAHYRQSGEQGYGGYRNLIPILVIFQETTSHYAMLVDLQKFLTCSYRVFNTALNLPKKPTDCAMESMPLDDGCVNVSVWSDVS
jgi:hypothetical protein